MSPSLFPIAGATRQSGLPFRYLRQLVGYLLTLNDGTTFFVDVLFYGLVLWPARQMGSYAATQTII